MTSQILWALFVLSVSGQGTLPRSGPFRPGIGDSSEALEVSEKAGRQPNATSSVTFTRTYDNAQEEWTWRVNISEIAVPDRIGDLGSNSANYSQGLHVANTQWQLEWPGNDQSLQALLAARNLSASFTTMISNKPSNVTDGYKEEDNGNCTTILGDQCTQSLTEAASKGNTIEFAGLEGCENTLNANLGGADGGSGFEIQPSTDDLGDEAFKREDTLFYRTSATFSGDNLTLFDQSKSALQVFIMSLNNQGGPQGGSSGATVLCRIVDKTAKSPDDPSAPDQPAAAALNWRQSTGAVFAVALLSALAIMW